MEKLEERSYIKDMSLALKVILRHAPGYIYWKDKKSAYLGCNINLAKLAGLAEPEDIVGKTDMELPWGDWQTAEFIEIDQEVMSSGVKHVSVNKLPLKRGDGSYLYIKTEKIPFLDEHGEVQGVFAIAIDITNEKIAELQLAKERQANIIAHMPGYIYWKNKNSEYMGCNNNLAAVSGLHDRSEIVGKTDFDFEWGEEQASKFVKEDREVMQQKITKITDNKMTIKRPDGNFYYVRTEKIPLYEDGEVIGVLGVAIDITDLKLLELFMKNLLSVI